MDEWSGKTVLVTGGSRGLGEAICRRFAAEGCRVLVNYAHGRDAAETVAAEIGGQALACDISDEAAVRSMFERIGDVDMLVNNARMDPYKRASGATDGEWWDAVMAVNLKGAYLCGLQALEGMKRKGWGRMIHISSPWAYQPPTAALMSYAASKAALHALSRGFARLGAPHGITSNVLAPGLILTELLGTRLDAEQLAREMAGIPLGRGAPPEEVASAAWRVADTPFMTGAVVNLNGGALMTP